LRDAVGNVQSLLVLGGTSEIALATARRLVLGRTRRVVLAVRDPESAGAAADELRRLGATDVDTVRFDALDFDSHGALVDEVFDRDGDVDLALIGWGTLGDQKRTSRDQAAAVEQAQRMRRQGHGTIVYLSSVAAERARKSNFVYGSSKAAMDSFAQGLGDAVADSAVRVMVVRPGFVRTKMTRGLDAAPLAVDADAVADAIVRGLRRGAHTVYAPALLRIVMSVLRHLPRPIFRRLDI
jgi:decaprenylphospho-beta-D-erythro-pentofuranosid-2-ulose 2-reductase